MSAPPISLISHSESLEKFKVHSPSKAEFRGLKKKVGVLGVLSMITKRP